MWKDPIVEEVRKVRRLQEEEFGTDQGALLAHIYDQQNKTKSKMVSRAPRKYFVRKAA